MKIEIIPLAARKAKRRGIKKEWIEETIKNPMQLVEGYGGRKVAQRKFFIRKKEFLLRVVFKESDGMYTVITTYLTSQIDRYWEEKS